MFLKFYRNLSLLLLASILLTGCGGGGGDQAGGSPETPEVAVMLARAVEKPVLSSHPGRLAPYRRAEVRARVPGILMKRHYVEGREVTEGELLYEIDDVQLKLDVLTAKSELVRAEAAHDKCRDTLKRHKNLFDNKAIQEHDYIASASAEKQAKAAVDYAVAALARAEVLLSYARVTAPIPGLTGLSRVSEGALVGQGEPTQMTTIEQVDPIYVDFSQPSADILTIDEGLRSGRLRALPGSTAEVRLRLPDGTFYEHAGHLIFTDSSVDPRTDNVAMRAVFPNPDRVLRPGAYLSVALTRALNPGAILVPRDSLLRQDSEAQVLLVSADDTVERRSVEAAELDGRYWLVSSGLKEGDRVIINSAQAARLEGQKVSAAPAEPEPDQLAAK